MDTTMVGSHALSAVLHALFLLLAFMAPVVMVLDDTPEWAADQRTVRLDVEDVVIETGFRMPLAVERWEEAGRGTAPGDGHGEDQGSAPRTVAKSVPPDPRPRIAAAGGAAFVEDVGGLLDGFADETLGPDSLTALGELDEGGGREGVGGLGFGAHGSGASCFGSWHHRRDGQLVTKRTKCPEALRRIGLGFAGISRLRGGERLPEPDLGDKGEAHLVPTVITSAPVGCLTASTCPWKDIIERVIRRHKRELEHCYETALHRQGREFSAEVAVSLGIAPGGGRADVVMSSTSGVLQFDACVERRAATWVFPATGFDIRANYPFRFDVI